MGRLLINSITAATSVLLGGCAVLVGPPQEPVVDWVDEAVTIFASPLSERQALRDEAQRVHGSDPTPESALRLAIVTLSMAESSAELVDAQELTELALFDQALPADSHFASLLATLISMLLESERRLEDERGEKLTLQAQLDALRQLEQELNSQ